MMTPEEKLIRGMIDANAILAKSLRTIAGKLRDGEWDADTGAFACEEIARVQDDSSARLSEQLQK